MLPSYVLDRKRGVAPYHKPAALTSSLPSSARMVATGVGHRGCVNCVAWNPTGSLLASTGDDLDIRLWLGPGRAGSGPLPASDGRLPGLTCASRVTTGHKGNVFSLAWMSGSTIASGAADGVVCVTDVGRSAASPSMYTNTCHVGFVHSVAALSPTTLLSASADGTVRYVDTRAPHRCHGACSTNALVRLRVDRTSVGVNSVAVNPVDDHEFAIAVKQQHCLVFDRRMPLRHVHTLAPHVDPDDQCPQQPAEGVTGIAYANDGARLAATYACGPVRVFDTRRGGLRDLRIPVREPVPSSADEERNAAISSVLRRLVGSAEPQPPRTRARSTLANFFLSRVRRRRGERTPLAISLEPPPPPVPPVAATPPPSPPPASPPPASPSPSGALRRCFGALRRGRQVAPSPPGAGAGAPAHVGEDGAEGGVEEEAPPALDATGLGVLDYDIAAVEEVSEPGLRELPPDKVALSEWRSMWRRHLRSLKFPCVLNLAAIPYGITEVARAAGSLNYRTVKQAAFLGADSQWVLAGSDCGHAFIWDAFTGEALAAVKADTGILNSIHGHPRDDLTFACSGISHDVKVVSTHAAYGSLATTWEVAVAGQREHHGVRRRCVGDVLTPEQVVAQADVNIEKARATRAGGGNLNVLRGMLHLVAAASRRT